MLVTLAVSVVLKFVRFIVNKPLTGHSLTLICYQFQFHNKSEPQILVLQIGQEIYLKLKEKELKLQLEKQELVLALNPPSTE